MYAQKNGAAAVFEDRRHQNIVFLFKDRLIVADIFGRIYRRNFSCNIKLTGHSVEQCRAYPFLVVCSFQGTWEVIVKHILSSIDRERALAFAMSQHWRVGSDSLAGILPEDLLASIILLQLVPNEVTSIKMRDYIIEIMGIELNEWWKEVRSDFSL
jgi:hypothetical protein